MVLATECTEYTDDLSHGMRGIHGSNPVRVREIRAIRGRVFSVISVTERLPDDFSVALAATVAERGVFGARLYYASEVGSTNDLAAAAADRGEPEGTTFVAGAPRAGAGAGRGPRVSPP